MKNFKVLLTTLLALAFLQSEASTFNDDLIAPLDNGGCEVAGGTLSGGPYVFCVDGFQDVVSDIVLEANQGDFDRWVITDENSLILSVQLDQSSVDFDQLGAGSFLIWHISYSDDFSGLAAGENLSGLEGCFELTNSIAVTNQQSLAGTTSGGIYNICVDGVSDFITDITVTGASGDNSAWVVTDTDSLILGLPGSPDLVDFDAAGVGTCLIWHVSYVDGLTGLALDNRLLDLTGCFDISNEVTVIRATNDNVAGTIAGDPFEFCVDGLADYATGVTVTGNEGEFTRWIATDESLNILAVMIDLEALDFDQLVPGNCEIWHITYSSSLDGLTIGNNIFDLTGCYALSNSIDVTRNQSLGGVTSGGIYFVCIDSGADFINDVTLSGETGDNGAWVVTDTDSVIVGLPGSPNAFDFNAQGETTSLMWHISYTDGLTGLELGNTFNDLDGCFGISNEITVIGSPTTTEPGTVTGGPFEFCIDGESDYVSGVSVSGNVGDFVRWVVTDSQLDIAAVMTNITALDFDQLPGGDYFIWHITYLDNVDGLSIGVNLFDLSGCYSLSNSIPVANNAGNGGELVGGPYNFCVDGAADIVANYTLTGVEGENSGWIITDTNNSILALADDIADVNFDTFGATISLIWHIGFANGISGLAVGNDLSDITGCFGLSNQLIVISTDNVNVGGTITGGPFEFCIDDEQDYLSGITVSGNSGENERWLITNEDLDILGVLTDYTTTDFNQAGAGNCLIWHINYSDGASGLVIGANVADVTGCYALSNSITITRAAEGGELSGGPYSICVDGNPDFIDGPIISGFVGPMRSWIVTDADSVIVALPQDIVDVDFDAAGVGVCLIWSVSYLDGLTGLEVGGTLAGLDGCYDLSNSVEVDRSTNVNNGGSITGGPFEFCIDGAPDFLSDITLIGNVGSNERWVITDADLLIQEVLTDPYTTDFDMTGGGVAYIWHINYSDGLSGLTVGSNVADILGCHDLSDSLIITKNAPSAGTLTGGPYVFCSDGNPDFITDLVLEGVVGDNSHYVHTDQNGIIIAITDEINDVDFDVIDQDECIIYYVAYYDTVTGLEEGEDLGAVTGCMNISNGVSVMTVTTVPPCPDGLQEESVSLLELYPNPAQDEVVISYAGLLNVNATLQILSIEGRLIEQHKLTGSY